LRQASTDAERALWFALRDRRLGGCKFRRQHQIGPFIADFACVEARLVVEIDGGQHFETEGLRHDASRSAKLQALGLSVLRFDNRQVLTELASVLHVIHEWLQRHHPHPSPLPHAKAKPSASRAGEGATQERTS
jgi:very-short-patch-repair endonuclease